MLRSSARATAIALVSLTVLTQQGFAQLREVPDRWTRGAVGLNVTLANPTGEFGDVVEFGGGVGGFGLLNLWQRAPLGLRIEAAYLGYGSETVRNRITPGIPRLSLDVTTENYIFTMGAGPQLTLGSGPVRPYVFGTAGLAYFATMSSVAEVSSTNFDDLTFSVTGGAGVQIGLTRGKTPVSLDLSAQTVRNGRTRYLREGSIRDLPDGSIDFTPFESETNMWTMRVGVTIGLR